MPPQTFFPTFKRLAHAWLFGALFLVWVGFAAYAYLREPMRPRAWAGYALGAGTPAGMFVLSVVYLLTLMARTTVDDDGIVVEGPLGRRSVRWAEVAGHNVEGTSSQGVTLYRADGGSLNVSYAAYEGDGLRMAIEERLRRLPEPTIEGREFRLGGRWVLSALLVGMIAFLWAAGRSMPETSRSGFMPGVAALGLLVVPLVLYAVTTRVVLQNGVLSQGSVFGTKTLALADVLGAEVRETSSQGGRSESLILRGPVTIRLAAQREGYAMLRDAILKELPPSVQPINPRSF